MLKNEQKIIGGLNIIFLFLSVYILAVLAIDLVFPFDQETRNLISIIDFGICIVFFFEFCYRLYVAPDKLAYLKWGWLDLLASVPTIDFFRMFRLFRVFRVLRVLRLVKASKKIYKYLFHSKREAITSSATAVALLIVLTGALLIIQVEGNADGSNIRTAEEAIWWSIVTVTTVGYGDYYPVTLIGRIISVFVMLAGIGLFGTFTASIASYMLGEKK